MRYLGIDYGAKRIGLSISSEGIAFPRGVFENDSTLLATLRELITKEKVTGIVIGDTRSFGGHENPVTKDAEKFIEKLKKDMGLSVATMWEAGSSVEASRFAGEKSPHDDSAAAAIILQRYLDMRGDAIHPMR